MRKQLNNISKVLCALMLCTGVVVTSCEGEEPVGGENIEQGGGENNGAGGNDGDVSGGNAGIGTNNSVITNESGGVTLTVLLHNITEIGASFYGEVKFTENYTAQSFGILYSDQEKFTIAIAGNIPIVDIYGTNYSVSLSSLKPNKKYYYTSYIKQGDVYRYGEIKSFTTASLVAPTLNPVSGVTEMSATISGKVHLALGTASDLEYGFQYCKSADFSSDVVSKKVTEMDTEGKFSVQISSLIPAQVYYLRSYIKMSGATVYGDVMEFIAASLVAPTLNSVLGVTEISATICGKVNLALGAASDLEYGFQYCQSADFSSDIVSKKVTEMDSEGKFSVQISSLMPAQVYYVRSYIKMSGATVYGNVMKFTTASLVAPTLNPASGITYNSATISGKINLPSEAASGLKYGFKYSKSPSFLSNTKTMRVLNLSLDNSFSVNISSLESSTTYYYCSYIELNGFTVNGEQKSFTTKDHPYIHQADLNVLSAIDLSISHSANCYIVSKSGTYKFKTNKGNSDTSVGNVSVAETLWETFGTSKCPIIGDLISAITYKNGYIAFQTADNFKEGNAVIAAKDAYGDILWSWHIWLTDQPEGQVYYNGAGTMMDRNLGATSATPGDVGALGLLYQWGRKDPFLGSSSIGSNTVAQSTITWPSAKSSSSVGTIEYATSHPTTYIVYNDIYYGPETNNFDWYYTGSSSTDNTRWTTSDKKKSIYDPCPPGWRVPDGDSKGVWSKAKGSADNTYNGSNEGMNFSGKFGSASTIWYPASGYRNNRNGSLYNGGGYGGYYWSASPDGYRAYSLYVSYDHVSTNYSNFRADGLSVRCLQE